MLVILDIIKMYILNSAFFYLFLEHSVTLSTDTITKIKLTVNPAILVHIEYQCFYDKH